MSAATSSFVEQDPDKDKQQRNVPLEEKSLRSAFVGNIPFEATEDQLKNKFAEVGTVLGFRIIYDKDTGQRRNYGFVEYLDANTASSAIRNLNGYEFMGRVLQVCKATGGNNPKDGVATYDGPSSEALFGESVPASEAPEAITKAVASLPPEQMYELMKQMKSCIQNNPTEARNMLLQNPQLAYALLQAQVVMKIVDPHTALEMLRKSEPPPSVLISNPTNVQNVTPIQRFRPPPSGAPGISYRQPFNPRQGSYSDRSGPPLHGPRSMMSGYNVPSGQRQPMTMTQQRPPADKEKANLLMQVLNLTPEQIKLLPADQIQSIMMLKQQMNKGGGVP